MAADPGNASDPESAARTASAIPPTTCSTSSSSGLRISSSTGPSRIAPQAGGLDAVLERDLPGVGVRELPVAHDLAPSDEQRVHPVRRREHERRGKVVGPAELEP